MPIKTITAFAPRGGALPKPAGAARATASRIVEIMRGEPGYAALVEAWWDTPLAVVPAGAVFHIVADERVYPTLGNPGGAPLPDGTYQTIGAYHLRAEADGDGFWRYHTEIHAPEVIAIAGPSLLGYALNRRLETLSGAPTFFGLFEMWWTRKEEHRAYSARARTHVMASGIALIEDFNSRGGVSEYSIGLAAA